MLNHGENETYSGDFRGDLGIRKVVSMVRARRQSRRMFSSGLRCEKRIECWYIKKHDENIVFRVCQFERAIGLPTSNKVEAKCVDWSFDPAHYLTFGGRLFGTS